MENELFIELEDKEIVDDMQKKIKIYTDDNKEIICNVVSIFENDTHDEYIAIVPENETKVFIYGFKNNDNTPELRKIVKDEEFEQVSKIFNNMLE